MEKLENIQQIKKLQELFKKNDSKRNDRYVLAIKLILKV